MLSLLATFACSLPICILNKGNAFVIFIKELHVNIQVMI